MLDDHGRKGIDVQSENKFEHHIVNYTTSGVKQNSGLDNNIAVKEGAYDKLVAFTHQVTGS